MYRQAKEGVTSTSTNMSFSIPPPNLRLVRAHTTPASMPLASTSRSDSRNLSPLRPLPTPPSSASTTHSRKSGSIRPLPSVPPSRSGSPDLKEIFTKPGHTRNESYGSMYSTSSSVVDSPTGGAMQRDVSNIPLCLRPATYKDKQFSLPSSSRRPEPRDRTPSSSSSSSQVSRPISKKKRPQLYIQIDPIEEQENPLPIKRPNLTIPIPQRRSSLDSLTQRTPSFLSPDQTLSPVVSRRRKRSSQQASSMLLLSMAIRDANANARRLQPHPGLTLEKHAPLQDSDDDDGLSTLGMGSSPLMFDLSEPPNEAQFLHFNKGTLSLSVF